MKHIKKAKEKIRPWCKKYGLKTLVVFFVLFNIFFVLALVRSLIRYHDTFSKNDDYHRIYHKQDRIYENGYTREFVETCVNGVCKHHENSHPLTKEEQEKILKRMYQEHVRMMKEFQKMNEFFAEQERLFNYYFQF